MVRPFLSLPNVSSVTCLPKTSSEAACFARLPGQETGTIYVFRPAGSIGVRGGRLQDSLSGARVCFVYFVS
jgi:hypothetical protein